MLSPWSITAKNIYKGDFMRTSTKSQRLLHSFQRVELLPEHYNYGDETPTLRDFGVAGQIANKLIAYGESKSLVCTFEQEDGKTPNRHHWRVEFLRAAIQKHMEIFGEAGRADLTPQLLELVATINQPATEMEN